MELYEKVFPEALSDGDVIFLGDKDREIETINHEFGDYYQARLKGKKKDPNNTWVLGPKAEMLRKVQEPVGMPASGRICGHVKDISDLYSWNCVKPPHEGDEHYYKPFPSSQFAAKKGTKVNPNATLGDHMNAIRKFFTRIGALVMMTLFIILATIIAGTTLLFHAISRLGA